MTTLYPCALRQLIDLPSQLPTLPSTESSNDIATRLEKHNVEPGVIEKIYSILKNLTPTQEAVRAKRIASGNSLFFLKEEKVTKVFISLHKALAALGSQGVQLTRALMLSFNEHDQLTQTVQEVVKLTLPQNDVAATRRISLMQKLADSHYFPENFAYFQKKDGRIVVFQEQAESDLYDLCNTTDHFASLDEGTKLAFCKQALGALKALEAHKIVHRDIKPENFLVFTLTPGTRCIKLSDLGLACLLDDHQELKKKAGSLTYSPPDLVKELLLNEKTFLPGHAQDIWGTGIIIHLLSANEPSSLCDKLQEYEQAYAKKLEVAKAINLLSISTLPHDLEQQLKALLKQFDIKSLTTEQQLRSLNTLRAALVNRIPRILAEWLIELATLTSRPRTITCIADLAHSMLQENPTDRIPAQAAIDALSAL